MPESFKQPAKVQVNGRVSITDACRELDLEPGDYVMVEVKPIERHGDVTSAVEKINDRRKELELLAERDDMATARIAEELLSIVEESGLSRGDGE